jgi:hypothetical protein
MYEKQPNREDHMNDVDRIFRAQMVDLGKKGGIATKRRLDGDPGYYRDLGARGGRASVDAPRARIAASLEQPKQSEPIVDPPDFT